MNTPTMDILRTAWHFPLENEDKGRDIDNRIESVRDAMKETNGDWSGYWSQCRIKRAQEARA